MLVFTGKVRFASKIEEKKIKNLKTITKELNILNGMVNECHAIFKKKKLNIEKLGHLLHKSWKIKKKLSRDVSNNQLNSIYNKAMKNGAIGGKLLGAGGGGFFYFVCDKRKKKKLIRSLNLKAIDFQLETEGSKIIFDNNKT